VDDRRTHLSARAHSELRGIARSYRGAVMNNVVHFPAGTTRRKPRAEYRSRTGDGQKNMHTYLFRSREALLEAGEAELIRDVYCDIDKAQKKLQKI
jgi:hypothetical protein